MSVADTLVELDLAPDARCDRAVVRAEMAMVSAARGPGMLIEHAATEISRRRFLIAQLIRDAVPHRPTAAEYQELVLGSRATPAAVWAGLSRLLADQGPDRLLDHVVDEIERWAGEFQRLRARLAEARGVGIDAPHYLEMTARGGATHEEALAARYECDRLDLYALLRSAGVGHEKALLTLARTVTARGDVRRRYRGVPADDGG